MDFAERVVERQRKKDSIVVLGVDPQLDTPERPGVPAAYDLVRFCCETVEACAPSILAIKVQLAFFEARGIAGMQALAEVLRVARGLGLITIADAKRGDIESTARAYAEAFLGEGDFGCDAVTVNPYLGSDSIAPFAAKARAGRGVFVIVRTSNPSSGEFQQLAGPAGALWEAVARRVDAMGSDFLGPSGLSSIGAVLPATYPNEARRARELMPKALILVAGYGAQGAGASDAVAAARSDGLGLMVNASRSLMYAYLKRPGSSPPEAAAAEAEAMRIALNGALQRPAA